MTYYAVIDTNVIVSSMLNNDSIPGRIMQYVSASIIIPLLSEEILKEYADVITRNKFGFSQISIDVLLSEIKEKGLFIKREQTLEQFIDQDDMNTFYIEKDPDGNKSSNYSGGKIRAGNDSSSDSD